MEPYASLLRGRELRLPNTDRIAAGVLALPTGPTIRERDIEMIGSIIRIALTRGWEISSRMAHVGRWRPGGDETIGMLRGQRALAGWSICREDPTGAREWLKALAAEPSGGRQRKLSSARANST